MGRVYKALTRAGRWDGSRGAAGRPESARQPGPARYPVLASVKRVAGAATGPRQVPNTFADAEAATSERHLSAFLPTAPVDGAMRCQQPNAQEGLIQFKTFRIRHSNVDGRLPAIRLGEERAREVYRTLAVRVSSIAAKRDIKTILVTSGRQGEGKTCTAANLAASLARVGKGRVLLVDGDLRSPMLGERLGILARFGWGDLIEGRSSLMDSIARIEPGGLHVLVNRSESQQGRSGTSEDLVDLMASQRPEELLAELKHQFHMIVIDCPCITEYAEAQRLALIADGTIFVVRAGYTHHRAVTDALKLVPKDRRIGIVLNESDADQAGPNDHKKRKKGWFSSLFS